jgi:glucosamine--fructose-6-phosphate aminotransferase (isomerizing)
VVCLILVALWFAQRKSFNQTKRLRAEIISELKLLSANMQTVIETCNPFSMHVAKFLAKGKEVMFLGEGLGEAVANEGSLKMKELTYLHC